MRRAVPLLRLVMLRALVLLAAIAAPLAGAAEPLPAAERAKIDSLIVFIEKLPNATFIRNGKSYDAATAAKFLRGKWRNRANEIRTAEEFIERVATKSSTSGKPYLVRLENGREIPAATLLREHLRKLTTNP